VNQLTKSVDRAYSPPCEGGVAAPLRKSCEATEAAQTGWSPTSRVSECTVARWVVSDHPVRSLKGGFAIFP
jgi:hypothetical protein